MITANVVFDAADDADSIAGTRDDIAMTPEGTKAAIDDAVGGLGGGSNYKTAVIMHDISVTGTQDVMVGFDPTNVEIIGCINGAVNGPQSNGGGNASAQGAFYRNSDGSFSVAAGLVALASVSGSAYAQATLSFISGGFRLTWAKGGSPTGTYTMRYKARG